MEDTNWATCQHGKGIDDWCSNCEHGISKDMTIHDILIQLIRDSDVEELTTILDLTRVALRETGGK